MNYQPKPITVSAKYPALGRVLCAACALLVLACAAEARQVKTPAAKARATRMAMASGRQAAPKPEPARYGPFSISNMMQMQSSQSKGTGKTKVKMDGPNLSAKSSRYDIASPHITLNLAKFAVVDAVTKKKLVQLHAETATATGHATVVFRNPDNDETTTVTCDRAIYAAANAVKDLGRLTMTGNVRSVTRGPAFGKEGEEGSTPLVQTWKTFYVEFVDADTINTGGEVGTITGAIREPAKRNQDDKEKDDKAKGAPKP